MKRVVLESPFAGDVEENIKYAKKCVHDCRATGVRGREIMGEAIVDRRKMGFRDRVFASLRRGILLDWRARVGESRKSRRS